MNLQHVWIKVLLQAADDWLNLKNGLSGIVFKTMNGENASILQESVEKWKNYILKPIMKEYKVADVFKCNETGLFYMLQLNKT